MTEVSRLVDAPPDTVFAVLSDGWLYAAWVVGSSHIRAVDPEWPMTGARIHHSIGPWPLNIEDSTEVTAMEPGVSLTLHARAWPFGAAAVGITLVPQEDGKTLVRMTEQAVRGPGSLVPERLQALALKPRNSESLSRLADLAVGGARIPR